jgi:CBS domain-containing protein
MTRNVITETDDQNIQAACKIMSEKNIGSVIIVKGSSASHNKRAYSNNNQEPVGIITERDVVRLMGIASTTCARHTIT